MGVQRGHEKFVAECGNAPVHRSTARVELPGQVPLIPPDRLARARVNRKYPVILPRGVQDAIHHQRGRLELAQRTSLQHPFCPQPRNIRWVNLVQCAVTPAGIIAGIAEPVLRLLA